jgi:hypothetical protein
VAATAEEADGLRITFGPAGHQAVFSREWLASLTAPNAAGRPALTRSEQAGMRQCAAADPVLTGLVEVSELTTPDFR